MSTETTTTTEPAPIPPTSDAAPAAANERDDEEGSAVGEPGSAQSPVSEIALYCFTISPQRLKMIKTLGIFILMMFMILFLCWVFRVGPFA